MLQIPVGTVQSRIARGNRSLGSFSTAGGKERSDTLDSREVKSILSIYRPGIDDDDPQFAEAERDPELRAWLFEQGKSYDEIRENFAASLCLVTYARKSCERGQSCFLSRQYALASGRLLRR